jgi:hypothetical protein
MVAATGVASEGVVWLKDSVLEPVRQLAPRRDRYAEPNDPPTLPTEN